MVGLKGILLTMSTLEVCGKSFLIMIKSKSLNCIKLYFQQKHELNKKVISFNQKGGYKKCNHSMD
jgi:hypothetical protein